MILHFSVPEVLKYEPGFLLVKEIETKDELLNLNLIRR